MQNMSCNSAREGSVEVDILDWIAFSFIYTALIHQEGITITKCGNGEYTSITSTTIESIAIGCRRADNANSVSLLLIPFIIYLFLNIKILYDNYDADKKIEILKRRCAIRNLKLSNCKKKLKSWGAKLAQTANT